ncbi:TolC family protein [Desulfovibrio psychrotolerans]|uniref:RND transporter n=1 Tax=Desulfovibrio psychrotolerans TaxID=415242 RepID=A0A7J0BVY7_9BACT|nr:TolC family protein [Desulfovibrio psychrotolerans]GFM37877.1 hypothetical protein DSM19430T_25610 [Desulfovibrio psychrotolerans]
MPIQKTTFKTITTATFLAISIFIFFFSKDAYADTSLPSQEPVELHLDEAVALALRTNRTVTMANIERLADKFDLEVAHDKFKPDVNFDIGNTYSGGQNLSDKASRIQSQSSVTPGVEVTQLFSTGSKVIFSWDRYADTSGKRSDNNGNSWSVNFSQPLLKGAGQEVNTASIVLAEMSEQSSLLSLKKKTTNTVNQTIRQFRHYYSTIQQLEINASALKRARDSLESNQLLVQLGRIPANEIIQSESQLANQEYAYQSSLDNVDKARLQLLGVLDLPNTTRIIPRENQQPTSTHPDLKQCIEIALKKRADHLEAEMNVERARINLMLAKNNAQWDLSLDASYKGASQLSPLTKDTGTHRWEAGVNLRIPLYGDLTREQNMRRADANLKQAEIALTETRENITLEVINAIRDVENTKTKLQLATKARNLSERKLEVEREKLSLGRSNSFQVVSFQNELVERETQELNALINHHNALTTLDETLNTTLETWQVEYNKEHGRWLDTRLTMQPTTN